MGVFFFYQGGLQYEALRHSCKVIHSLLCILSSYDVTYFISSVFPGFCMPAATSYHSRKYYLSCLMSTVLYFSSRFEFEPWRVQILCMPCSTAIGRCFLPYLKLGKLSLDVAPMSSRLLTLICRTGLTAGLVENVHCSVKDFQSMISCKLLGSSEA